MSLSESLYGEVPERPQTAAIPRSRDVVEQLVDALNGLLLIQNIQRVQGSKKQSAVVFRGKLTSDAETLYPVIAERFKALGFTPLLERSGETDVVVAMDGVIVGRRISSRLWVHILLLVITIITATITGAQFRGYGLDAINQNIFIRGNWSYLFTRVLPNGAPFALTLLVILGVHEMGHYLAARRHRVDVTPPYFIPLPPTVGLGTLGAVIFIKSPFTSRKSLFDVGISGPLAGFIVALIAFIISMFLPKFDGPNRFLYENGISSLGMPLLLQGIGSILKPGENLAMFVSKQPIALAAWFGMLLTALNLFPLGQFDGGHIMYTLFGRFAWTIAFVTFGALIFFGLTTGFPGFIIYALMAMLTGLRHPPPNNDITPLDRRRQILGYATIVLFFLIGTPTPFILAGQ